MIRNIIGFILLVALAAGIGLMMGHAL